MLCGAFLLDKNLCIGMDVPTLTFAKIYPKPDYFFNKNGSTIAVTNMMNGKVYQTMRENLE